MRSNGLKWWDVVVGSTLLLFVGTLAVAQLTSSEEIANRVKCASNLRQLGQALLLYSNDNRGAFPRTIANVNDPKPVWGTPYQGNEKLGPEEIPKVSPYDAKISDVVPKPNDVTAALFMLLRTQDITSEVFTCPSSGKDKWEYGGGTHVPLEWSNFRGDKVLAEHLSYCMENPYPTREAVGHGFKWNNTLGAEYAVMADMNPGVDALLKLTPRSSSAEMQKGNSFNHAGDGQNILYGDGHVAYESNPFVGVNRDNVYTYGASGENVKNKGGEGIVGPPSGADDSILLPTSKDIGELDADGKLTAEAQKRREGIDGDMKPGTPAEQAAAQKAIVGNYVMAQGGQTLKLRIDEKQIIASSGPVTITFGYQIAGVASSVTRLELSAPDTPPSHVVIRQEAGGIVIKGVRYFEGTWKRE